MILIFPQIQFEAIPSKNAGEVAFQSEADRSHKILGFCHKSFSLVAHMALIFEIFGLPWKRPFQKCILLFPPPPPTFISQVKAKYIKNVLWHTNSDRIQQNYERYLAEFISIEKWNFWIIQSFEKILSLSLVWRLILDHWALKVTSN